MSRIPKSIRESVRRGAIARCEYCLKPDLYTSQPYHADHIIAQKHRGSDELDNLAWACFQCNVCEGTDIAAIDPETNTLTPLYNPRTQEWDDHFELNHAVMIGLTAAGRATIFVLQMNSEDQIAARRLLIDNGLW